MSHDDLGPAVPRPDLGPGAYSYPPDRCGPLRLDDDDPVQCSAITRRGHRCPTLTRDPSGRCHVH